MMNISAWHSIYAHHDDLWTKLRKLLASFPLYGKYERLLLTLGDKNRKSGTPLHPKHPKMYSILLIKEIDKGLKWNSSIRSSGSYACIRWDIFEHLQICILVSRFQEGTIKRALNLSWTKMYLEPADKLLAFLLETDLQADLAICDIRS